MIAFTDTSLMFSRVYVHRPFCLFQIGSLNLNVEECEPCELRVLSEEELQSVDIEVLQQDREQYETELKKLKPNLASIEAFKTKVSAYSNSSA